MGDTPIGGSFKRDQAYAYSWLIHVVLQQNPTQHCEVIILQLKIHFREGGSGWGTHVHPWQIHVNVWHKPTQYCNVISFQLIKINEK